MTGKVIVNNYQTYENWIDANMLNTRYSRVAVIVSAFLLFYLFIKWLTSLKK